MHAKRVVVTGYGAVSALGENVPQIWDAIMNYRVGYQLTEFPDPKINARFFSFMEDSRQRYAGFPKAVLKMLPTFNGLIHRVRKIRIMGAAALSLVYVATGRMDAYVEYGLRLWDIAAGGLIIECAGGDFWSRAVNGEYTYEIVASNGRLRGKLERAV